MPAPILTKTWNITPNLRNSFTSLANMAGWFLYRNKVALTAAGWTIKFTCDGTTGPSGPADTTDRWSTQASAQTRGAASAAAQSYAVLQNTDGVQILLAYQGATDDVGRLSFSPGGLFALATPSTGQPTATDEVVWSTGNSLVDATTSLDRVMTIWTTSDTRHWSVYIARNGATVNFIGCERVNSYCGPGVFAVPYVGYRYQRMDMHINPSGTVQTPCGAIQNVLPSATGFLGCAARVFTNAVSRIVRVGGGGPTIPQGAGLSRIISGRFFASTFPALQASAAAPCLPFVWSSEKTANTDGFLGSPVDWWICQTDDGTTPAVANVLPGYDVGDSLSAPPRPNWLVSLGSEAVRPWKDAAAALLLT